jgi:Dyp-type peroxidase family
MPTTNLNLTNIQGNILGGFNKDHQLNLFLKFKDAAAGRAWIEEVADDVAASSSADVIQFNNEFSALRRQGVRRPEDLISAVWVNLALSFQGMKALGLKQTDLDSFPEEFKGGMASRGAAIGDAGASAPAKWMAPFNKPEDIHALLIVAADHSHQLRAKVDAITGTNHFKAGVDVLLRQAGNTRPDAPGHEHFGFKDGISQPGVRGVDTPDDPIGNPDQGHPGQDLLWPGEFVLGYATQIPTAKEGVDGPNPDPGTDSKSGPSWAKDGSYLVFRRLGQDVQGFESEVRRLANQLGWSEDLTGAKLVGRYKSGAPIEQRKFQPGPYTPPSTDPGRASDGNPALGNNNALNNNFEFGDDSRGAICPVAAHIRKAYPRDEVTPAGPENSEPSTQTRRILRRGIPYGPSFIPHDPDSARAERGLLFLCYQNSIANHFEFIQTAWVNNPKFPPRAPAPGAPELSDDAGQDPIIAQSANGSMLINPDKPPVTVAHFVTTTGGEYFFSPAINVLRDIGSNQRVV